MIYGFSVRFANVLNCNIWNEKLQETLLPVMKNHAVFPFTGLSPQMSSQGNLADRSLPHTWSDRLEDPALKG